MTYDEALDRTSGGGRMIRASKLEHGLWTELHLTDPMQERPEKEGPFLFVNLASGDLARWEPSDEDRAAEDWMAA